MRSLGNDRAVSSPEETRPSLFSGIPESFSHCIELELQEEHLLGCLRVEIMPRF